MLRHYYYNKQLKKCAIVFANIFAGLRVRTGLNGCGETTDIMVPVRYGSTDRVASAIGASDTQNKLHTLPMMSVYMTGIELAPERQHGVSHVDRRTYLEQGAVFPDDVKVAQRVMPIPYNLTFELGIYASNTDQAYQILEQLLILFDYDLQVQMNDAAFDWSKITRVTLESVNNEENYPVGPDRRAIIWTLTFGFETYLSPPMSIRTDIINQINIQIGDPEGYHMEEYDEDGNLIPFDDDALYTSFQVLPDVPADDVNPGMESPQVPTLGYDARLTPAVHPPTSSLINPNLEL